MKKGLAILISLLAIGAGIFTGYLFTEILDTPNKQKLKKKKRKKKKLKRNRKWKTIKLLYLQ